ncbi:transketolase C-terminal domain-containing protein [Escherichia coli]
MYGEENAIMGGAGSGVNEVLMAHRKPVPVLNIGLPDFFYPQGTQEEMRAELGLDAAGMEAKIKAWLDSPRPHRPNAKKLFMAGVAACNTTP